MSQYDFLMRREIEKLDPSFAAIIMAAMHKADTTNAALLRTCWPLIWDELDERYNRGDGLGRIPGDPQPDLRSGDARED